ncbi:hypothetical protein TBR22_A35270 [Luteitalea sp. TBR-22]|nr:hypothetical protein TBR22_A35270 [Luteitalea sp. TBR-22]
MEPLHDLAAGQLATFAHTEPVAKDDPFFRRFRGVCYFHRARPFRVSKAAAITRIAPLVLQRPHQPTRTCRSVPSLSVMGGSCIGAVTGRLHCVASAHKRAMATTNM